MGKLKPESKKVYVAGGVQLFSKSDLGKLLGIHRNTVNKNIGEWEIKPAAQDNRGYDLYAVSDYIAGMIRGRVSDTGDDVYGGYADASEWKAAVDAQRGELKLEQERGLLVSSYEAEMEIAACFADCARMGDNLLSIVDNVLHPDGQLMAEIEGKFKKENSKYYERVMSDTEDHN